VLGQGMTVRSKSLGLEFDMLPDPNHFKFFLYS
jgi:hypothetical protein